MTIKEARKILKNKNIHWKWYMDLRNELLRNHTPEVKKALYVLCDFILHG